MQTDTENESERQRREKERERERERESGPSTRGQKIQKYRTQLAQLAMTRQENREMGDRIK